MREIKFRAVYNNNIYDVETRLPKIIRSKRYKGWYKRQGYIIRLITEHPFADKRGYVPEHRLVMEQSLGRFLEPTEIIHHKDQNRENNNLSNLELQGSQQAHIYNYHLVGRRNTHGQFICNEPIFSEIKFRLYNKNTKTTRIYTLATLITTTFRRGQFEFRGRWTGLLDKNGKEIYEGDIIDHIATTGVVIFEDGMFALDSNANTQFGKYKQPLCYMSVLECEVIGNIYENAELLK